MNIIIKKALTVLGLSVLISSCQSDKEPAFVDGAIEYCTSQIRRSIEQLSPANYNMSPRTIDLGENKWSMRKVNKNMWTVGFWPGILWYGYEASGDETMLNEARLYTEALASIAEPPAKNHDIGFMMFCSYGNGYRIDRNEDYKQIIVKSAETLGTLYNPNAGTILSWPGKVNMYGGHNTIIDNIINLEMLFWAAENGGSQKFFDMAVSHADQTMKHSFRPDYAMYQIVVYDSESGEKLSAGFHPGHTDDSMWARGQAWAIYGYTMCYRFTEYPRYLETAQKAADIYIKRLPESLIPYWDFADPKIPDAPYDSSAAAIVASGLIELSEYVGGEKGNEYLKAAEAMLMELDRNYRSDSPALLNHVTGNRISGSEVDASIIYADYYYLEALVRLRNHYAKGRFICN